MNIQFLIASLLIILSGILAIAKPLMFRKLVWWTKDPEKIKTRSYGYGAVTIFLGILLLLASIFAF